MVKPSLLRRLARVEQAVQDRIFSADCICFSKREQPFFEPIEYEVALRVRCPVHGKRAYIKENPLYTSAWLRKKTPFHFWQNHTPRFRVAWFASFCPDFWPAENKEIAREAVCLKLEDGRRIGYTSKTGWISREDLESFRGKEPPSHVPRTHHLYLFTEEEWQERSRPQSIRDGDEPEEQSASASGLPPQNGTRTPETNTTS